MTNKLKSFNYFFVSIVLNFKIFNVSLCQEPLNIEAMPALFMGVSLKFISEFMLQFMLEFMMEFLLKY